MTRRAGPWLLAVALLTAALAPCSAATGAVSMQREDNELSDHRLVFNLAEQVSVELAMAPKFAPAAVHFVFNAAQLDCYTTWLVAGAASWRIPLSEECAAAELDQPEFETQVLVSAAMASEMAASFAGQDLIFLDPASKDIVILMMSATSSASENTDTGGLYLIGRVARRPQRVDADLAVREVQLINTAWHSETGAETHIGQPQARRMLREHNCDDSILEYISGAKANVTIIPYTESCIAKYRARGHKVALPNTVGVHMTGLPKTGTTWTEVFVGKLLEGICNSGMYNGCKFDLTYRGAMATIPSGHHHAGNVIRWNTFLKHDPPFDWTCKGFEVTRRSASSGCHQYQFQDAERNIPDWEQCIFSSTYQDIGKCVPPYMSVLQDLPVLDKLAQEMQQKKKTDINWDGAKRKYIHVIRDPRDAALSWIHYHGVTSKTDIDKGVGKACNHYIAWTAFYYYWQMERYGEVYPSMELFYRKLMDDAKTEYIKVLEWFGVRASSETLMRVLKETDMGAMKRMEAQRLLPGRNRAGSSDCKVRQGGYGNFNDELSEATIAKCTGAMKVMLPENLLRMFDVLETDAEAAAWDPSTLRNPLL